MPLFRSASLFWLLLLAEVVLLWLFSLITMSYIIRTKRFIWKDLKLLLLHSLGVYLVIHRGLGIIRGLPPQRGINGLVVGMITGFTVGCLLIRKPIFVVQELIR
jgi:hypothetical protein